MAPKTPSTPSKGETPGSDKGKAKPQAPNDRFLSGALTGAGITAVILIGGALAAFNFGMVPCKGAVSGEGSCPACPACPKCPAAATAATGSDAGSKKELEQLRSQLKDVEKQNGISKAAASECQTQQAAQAKTQQAAAADCQSQRSAAAKCQEQLSHANNQLVEAKEAAGSVVKAPAANPAKSVLAEVLDNASLIACDSGVSDACPDLYEAMRTWNTAIESLKALLAGKEHNFANFIDQISSDAEYFLSKKHPEAEAGEMYSVSAANNRQVLDAVRSWVQNTQN